MSRDFHKWLQRFPEHKRRAISRHTYQESLRPVRPQPPIKPLPVLKDRMLRVTTGYFTAGAIFHGPHCVRAAPIIRWMVGKDAPQIHLALMKMGAQWSWSKLSESADNQKRTLVSRPPPPRSGTIELVPSKPMGALAHGTGQDRISTGGQIPANPLR